MPSVSSGHTHGQIRPAAVFVESHCPPPPLLQESREAPQNEEEVHFKGATVDSTDDASWTWPEHPNGEKNAGSASAYCRANALEPPSHREPV